MLHFLLALFLISPIAAALPAPEQAARVRALEDSLLSPCCFGGTVATHGSAIAEQMRHEISDMVSAGKSDQEIRDFYVKEFGPQVLAEPPGSKRLLLYGIPVAIAALGLFFVFMYLRRALHARGLRPAGHPAAALDISILNKVRADVDDV